MASKFIGLDEAAAQLGLTRERLNEIRESGDIRAYRDGASWKFRAEDIEGLASRAGELADEPESSGLDLDEISLESSGLSSLSLDLDEPEDKNPEHKKPEDKAKDVSQQAATSDLDLELLDEPTVAVDAEEAGASGNDLSDIDIGAGAEELLEEDDDNASILLSEEELGGSLDRPPSTIIGRSQLRDEPSDDDLDLSIADEAEESVGAGMSDVRLADDDDVDELITASPAGKFDDLEELEIDLEAESSRILEAQDVAAARAAAKKMATPSDVDLTLSGSSVTFSSGTASPDDPAATGVLDPAERPASDAQLVASDDDDEPLELELVDSGVGEGGSGSNVELDVDLSDSGSDDFVLGASDDEKDSFTLSSADSGINLRPSDSGLSLDDGSFALGGSALGSSLDLGDSVAVGGASEVSLEGSTAFTSSPDFNLQPADDEDEDDEDDSSQIIALDAIEEPGEEDEASLSEASIMPAGAQAMGGVGVATSSAMSPEIAFPIWIVALLGLSTLLMTVTAVMATDLLRSMWAWEEPYSLQSPLIQGFLGLIGLG